MQRLDPQYVWAAWLVTYPWHQISVFLNFVLSEFFKTLYFILLIERWKYGLKGGRVGGWITKLSLIWSISVFTFLCKYYIKIAIQIYFLSSSLILRNCLYYFNLSFLFCSIHSTFSKRFKASRSTPCPEKSFANPRRTTNSSLPSTWPTRIFSNSSWAIRISGVTSTSSCSSSFSTSSRQSSLNSESAFFWLGEHIQSSIEKTSF